ncbi:MAG: peptidylprolyl isomerase [Rhodoferax sp.]|nr:peptidylprolyl isomerase [Rhodoferax sp.]
MKNKLVTSFALAALVTALSPLAYAQNIAIVNGKAVPKARVEALTQQVTRSGRQVTPEIEKQIKDEVIAREIFMQEAKKQGLDATESFRSQLELARQAILIRELFTNYQQTHAVSDAEVKAEYDKFAAANAGKEYRASHILVEKEAEAQAILAQLKKGGKFEEIAQKSSKDPGSGAKGGDLDWAPASNYVAEFAHALTAMTKGQTSETPVKSQFGYHIIRLDDVRDAQLPTLEQVKPQVKQQLEQQKLAKFQEELRSKARVE